MAISFIPEQTEEAFIIGGQSTIGPFPKYSIGKETNATGDGTTLNNKYSIVINGQFIVDSDVDIGTSGARQSNYNQKIIQRLSAMRQFYNSYGRLEITPYGGQPHKLIWNDARLINVEIPESSDESASILYSDFVFQFEAYTEVSIIGTTDDNFATAVNSFDYDKFFVSSVEETWELSIDDDVTYNSSNVTTQPQKTFTVTHNLSATGLHKPLSAGGFDSSAWKEAQRWVQSRLQTDPSVMQTTDMMGGQDFTQFAGKFFGSSVNNTSTDLSAYFFYNHMRTPNINIGEGSYSVTESWKASNFSASTIELTVDIDVGDNQNVTVSANGSIQGLDSDSLNSTAISKISSAEASLLGVSSVIYDLCNSHYNKLNTGLTLSNVIRAQSIGRNSGTGLITFTYSYSDVPVLLDNALSTDLSIIDDNRLHQVQLIAVIPIIAKSGGPVIQNMATSRERKRSVQLDAVMKRGFRSIIPTQAATVVLGYAPTVSTPYIQNYVENLNPLTGALNVSVEWTY